MDCSRVQLAVFDFFPETSFPSVGSQQIPSKDNIAPAETEVKTKMGPPPTSPARRGKPSPPPSSSNGVDVPTSSDGPNSKEILAPSSSGPESLLLTIDVFDHDLESEGGFSDFVFNKNKTAGLLISANCVASFTLPAELAGLRSKKGALQNGKTRLDAFVVCKMEKEQILQRVRWFPRAEGHVAVLTESSQGGRSVFRTFNLGTHFRKEGKVAKNSPRKR